MARNVRRAVGVTAEPGPIAMDPSSAYLAPGSVARLVHGDLPSMLIGGLSALMLQMLHPLAMAGVAEHSKYREDPVRRLRRTAEFVSATTFGTVEPGRGGHRPGAAGPSAGQGNGARRPRLFGRRPRAGDLHPRGGGIELPRRRRGATAPACSARRPAIGITPRSPRWRTRSAPRGSPVRRTRSRPTSCGCGTSSTRVRRRAAARDWLVYSVARRPDERAVYALVLAAAVGVLPRWARLELGLTLAGPVDLLIDTAAVDARHEGSGGGAALGRRAGPLSRALRWRG